MRQGKQAKILTDAQVRAALAACDAHRYPLRDRTMILLSVRAGLRAKEIACLKWGMVTDAEGQVGDALHLDNKSSKGRNGGRTVPLHAELRVALVALKETRNVDADDRVIFSERTIGMSPTAEPMLEREDPKARPGYYRRVDRKKEHAEISYFPPLLMRDVKVPCRRGPQPHLRSRLGGGKCRS